MSFKTLPDIINIEVRVFDTIWARDMHRNRRHELLHVLSGHFELTYADGRRFPATAGDTLISPAGSEHRDVFAFQEDLKIMAVHFAWEHFEEFSRAVDNRRINGLHPEVRTEVRWIFDRMREDCGGGEPDRGVAAARLMNILTLIHRDLTRSEKPAREGDRRSELISAARRYIERNFASPLRLEEIAAHLQVSPFHLSRVFSQESDFSLFEYLTEVRINDARKLLRDGRMSVAEVAERTGYDNGNYFAKVFRRKVGCSPGEYRRKQ